MVKNCGKCAKAINGIEFVVCRGYCGATFHINECSGATRAMLSYFTTHKKNLFWMCDKCADLFENSHFRAISCQADETSPLASLTSAITELRTEMSAMVKANLNIDADPPIVKLVPKGRTIESLSFVSFKIGLDPSLQQIALDPETWPEGLLFREFEDYGAPKFRFPLTTTPSLLTPQAASSPATPVMDLS